MTALIAQSEHSHETIAAGMRELRSLLTRPDDHVADPAVNRTLILTNLGIVEAGITELVSRRLADQPGVAASAQADREFESGVNPDDDVPFGNDDGPHAAQPSAPPNVITSRDPGDETQPQRAERVALDRARGSLSVIDRLADAATDAASLDSALAIVDAIRIEAREGRTPR